MFKEVCLNSLADDESEQRFQWLHIIKKTDFTELVYLSHQKTNKKQQVKQLATTANIGEETDFQNCHIIFFKCLLFNKNGLRRGNQVWPIHILRRKKLIKTVPEEAQMLYLLDQDQDFKLAILNMFKELKGIIYKELKESMRTILPNREH